MRRAHEARAGGGRSSRSSRSQAATAPPALRPRRTPRPLSGAGRGRTVRGEAARRWPPPAARLPRPAGGPPPPAPRCLGGPERGECVGRAEVRVTVRRGRGRGVGDTGVAALAPARRPSSGERTGEGGWGARPASFAGERNGCSGSSSTGPPAGRWQRLGVGGLGGRRPSQPVCSGAGGRSALAVVPVLFCPFRPLKGRRQLGVIVYRRSRIWLAEFGG